MPLPDHLILRVSAVKLNSAVAPPRCAFSHSKFLFLHFPKQLADPVAPSGKKLVDSRNTAGIYREGHGSHTRLSQRSFTDEIRSYRDRVNLSQNPKLCSIHH